MMQTLKGNMAISKFLLYLSSIYNSENLTQHCLKITENVSFEILLFNSLSFEIFWTCIVK